MFQAGGGGQTLSLSATVDIRQLREHLADFYSAVDVDRQRIKAEIRAVASEVAELHQRVLRVNPDAVAYLEGELAAAGCIAQGVGDMAETRKALRRKMAAAMTANRFDADRDDKDDEPNEQNAAAPNGSVLALGDISVVRPSRLGGISLEDEELDDLEDEQFLAEVDRILAESAALRVGGPQESPESHNMLSQAPSVVSRAPSELSGLSGQSSFPSLPPSSIMPIPIHTSAAGQS